MLRALQILAAVAMALPLSAAAQSWPSKPVRLVVPYPPGSFLDVVARLVIPPLVQVLGQPVVVDNRPGAGEALGAEAVARAAPDGHTLLLSSVNPIVFRPFLVKNIPYDPIRDFTPVTEAASGGSAIVVHSSTPVGSFADLIRYARENPGKISFGTAGIGTGSHLAAEQIQKLSGTHMVHVPYKSATQPLQEVVAGQIPMSYVNVGSLASQLKSGKLKVLAVTGASRNRRIPDVPAVDEVIRDFRPIPSWFGFLAPGGLPPALLGRTHAEITRVLAQAEVRSKIEATGFDVVGSTPEEFASSIRRDIAIVRDIVKAAGIEPLE